MKQTALALVLSLVATAALAQGPGPGPGPGPPPDPWVVNGSTISYTQGNVGIGTASPSALLTVSNNAGTLAPQTGSLIQVIGANGTTARAEIDSIAASGRFTCVRADGTAASPTAIQSGDELCSNNSFGYNGSANVGPQAAFRTYAGQNWVASSSYGTYADLALTPNGSTTLTEIMKWIPGTGGGSATIFGNGIGATSTDGYVLNNTTAAATAAQQWSPRLHFIGQGWKTASTAASETVDWTEQLVPAQGSSAPTSLLEWSSQVNGAGYTADMTLSSPGVLNVLTGVDINGTPLQVEINTTVCTINGPNCAITATASSLTIGTTIVLTSPPAGCALFNSAGVLGCNAQFALNAQGAFLNFSASAAPAIVTNAGGQGLEVVGDDSLTYFSTIQIYSAAGARPILAMVGTEGTVASPTATQSGDVIGSVQAYGYGTSVALGGIIFFEATQTWTVAHNGSDILFYTTPNNSTVLTVALTIGQDQSLTAVGPVEASNLSIASGKVATISNTLTFTGTDSSSVAFGTGGTVAYTNVATLSSLASVGTMTTGKISTGFVVGGVTMTLGSDATGDMYYRNSSGVLTRLAEVNGDCVVGSGGVPTYGSCGSTSPGGSSGQIQWNSSSAFAGISDWTTSGTTDLTGASGSTLAVNGAVIGATGNYFSVIGPEFDAGGNETNTFSNLIGISGVNSTFTVQRNITSPPSPQLAQRAGDFEVNLAGTNSSSNGFAIGLQANAWIPSTNSGANGAIWAIDAQAFNYGSDSVGNVFGVKAEASNFGTGTVTNQYGLLVGGTNNEGGTVTNSEAIDIFTPGGPPSGLTSTWTNLDGMHIKNLNPTPEGGTVVLTNSTIAILIDSQTASGAYAIQQNGSGLNLFSGNTTFGGTITAASLATPSGNIAGSACLTSGGSLLYNASGNCYPVATTITAGSTATSGITSGDVIGSSSNLAVDSGVAYANIDTLSGVQTITGAKTFNIASTIASGASATLDDINVQAATTTVTGTTNITTAQGFNKVSIYTPTFTASSSVTVSVADTLYIDGQPTCTGSLTCTQKYALRTGAGDIFHATGNEVTTFTALGPNFARNASMVVQRQVTSSLGTTTYGLYVDMQSTVTTTGQTFIAAEFDASVPSTDSTNISAIEAITTTASYRGTATLSLSFGLNNSAGNAGTGTVTTSIANEDIINNSGGGTNGTSTALLIGQPSGATSALTSTWTNISGIEIRNQNPSGAGTNTLTNAPVGLLIDSQTASGAYALNEVGLGIVQFATVNFNLTGIASSTAAQTGTVCIGSGGTLTYDPSLGCLTSLEELKDVHGDIDGDAALAEVGKMIPFWFTPKDRPAGSDLAEQPGLGAHQVEAVDRRLVGYGPDGQLRGVRYQELTAVLVAAIKGLKADNDNLQAEVTELKKSQR